MMGPKVPRSPKPPEKCKATKKYLKSDSGGRPQTNEKVARK